MNFNSNSKTFHVVLCPALTLDNGDIAYHPVDDVDGQYLVDTVAIMSCDYGYMMSGAERRTCQMSGTWDQETTTCDQSNKNNAFWRINRHISINLCL